jgi:Domain of unknown function (DUF4286)
MLNPKGDSIYEAYSDYDRFLEAHVKEMLVIDGIVDAKIIKALSLSEFPSTPHFVVLYTFQNFEALNAYLKHLANEMRSRVPKDLIDKVKIERACYSESFSSGKRES